MAFESAFGTDGSRQILTQNSQRLLTSSPTKRIRMRTVREKKSIQRLLTSSPTKNSIELNECLNVWPCGEDAR